MIVFENGGEIDLRAISTFGVSVKDGENPIGFFGTGLKYALAVLLRNGQRVTAHVGARVAHFGLQRDQVRGQEFEFITMTLDDGQPAMLGFTTQLGKQWELWMAYRELACNCKDEGGAGRYTASEPLPLPGRTHLIVHGQEFEAVFADGHQYILSDAPHMTVGTTEIRRRRSNHLYYRGVRVMELPRSALFTFNLNVKISLTEDRTVANQWETFRRIAQAVLESEDDDFIRTCVTAPDDTLEGGLDYHGWGVAPSANFLHTVGEAVTDRMCKVNSTALKVWMDATKQVLAPREITLSKVQLVSLQRAVAFCKRLGYDVEAYPVKVVESLGDGYLGLAKDGTIFITERVFHMGGAKQIASTLIEEFLHLRHGWKDCTRELQTYLFEKLVSLGEELAGEPL